MNCPKCQADMADAAVMCVSCGMDLRTGEQRQTEFGSVEDRVTGQRFRIIKGDQGQPILHARYRAGLFNRLRSGMFDLRRYREIGTRNRSIERKRSSDPATAHYAGELYSIYLVPCEDEASFWQELRAIFGAGTTKFVFIGRTTSGFFRRRRPSVAQAYQQYSALIDLIRDAHPLPILPKKK